MMISMELLRQTVGDFTKFEQSFSRTVENLSDVAMKCIQQCVEAQIGAKNFEDHRKEREVALKTWLDKKKIYDQKAIALDDELEELQKENASFSADRERLECQEANLQDRISRMEDELERCNEHKLELQQETIDSDSDLELQQE